MGIDAPADPILAELRQIREERFARFGGDIRAMIADLVPRRDETDRRGVRDAVPPLRPAEPGLPAESPTAQAD